jgi:hypothetical protein
MRLTKLSLRFKRVRNEPYKWGNTNRKSYRVDSKMKCPLEEGRKNGKRVALEERFL